MHISVAFERLLLFFAICLIFVHTLACAWVWLAYENEMDTNEPNWIMMHGFSAYDNYDLYVTAVYFTVTTITTVGYGDIYAVETYERLLGILTMVIGVIAFSFSTGSLSSIISNVDSKQAAFRQKLETLKRLKFEYDIDERLYEELMAFISFQAE